MKPSLYPLYKIFEPALEKATTSNTPCADNNYHGYKETVTHGFGPVKMTLDLYNPDEEGGSSLSAEASPTSQTTTVYTLEKAGICGQVDVPTKYVSMAIKFDKNLKEGTCASVGYTVADGSVSHTVPFLGKLTVKEYKKPAALLRGAAADPSTPCCKVCTTAGEEKYFSIDLKHGFCGEACMKPSLYPLYKIFEPALEKATTSNTPCADNNYHGYKETVTHGFGPVKMTLDLYNPAKEGGSSLSAEAIPTSQTTTVYTLEKAGICGQVDVPTKYVSMAIKFDKNLKEGTCASVGYTVADGSVSHTVPFP